MEKDEAMLSPYFDYIVSTKEELSHLLLHKFDEYGFYFRSA